MHHFMEQKSSHGAPGVNIVGYYQAFSYLTSGSRRILNGAFPVANMPDDQTHLFANRALFEFLALSISS